MYVQFFVHCILAHIFMLMLLLLMLCTEETCQRLRMRSEEMSLNCWGVVAKATTYVVEVITH